MVKKVKLKFSELVIKQWVVVGRRLVSQNGSHNFIVEASRRDCVRVRRDGDVRHKTKWSRRKRSGNHRLYTPRLRPRYQIGRRVLLG